MTEFDDIAIAILPIVEGGEIVADGLEISQAILEWSMCLEGTVVTAAPAPDHIR
jgi:hypothetical protein